MDALYMPLNTAARYNMKLYYVENYSGESDIIPAFDMSEISGLKWPIVRELKAAA